MGAKSFDEISFQFGIDPAKVDSLHEQELHDWFKENVHFKPSNLKQDFNSEPLIFKFAAYAPMSFTFKVYNRLQKPYVFEKINPDEFLGAEFQEYLVACETRNSNRHLPQKQTRYMDERRRDIHISLAQTLIEKMEGMGFDFSSEKNEDLKINRMRIVIARMGQFDERFEMRTATTNLGGMRDRLLRGVIPQP